MSDTQVSEHTIQIELEGLISLLAQHLYADPDVFLREMIQNAHDSISRRAALAAEGAADELPPGEIRITVEQKPPTLEIADNGSGLGRDEIHRYLATIGRSGTDELRREIRQGRHRAVELIGQFGIGL